MSLGSWLTRAMTATVLCASCATGAHRSRQSASMQVSGPGAPQDMTLASVLQACGDAEIQRAFADALELARFDEPSAENTEEVVGGVGQHVEGGQPVSRFSTFVRRSVFPSTHSAICPTAKEIAQKLGMIPLFCLHTHQLADRNAYPLGKQGAEPSSGDKDWVRMARISLVVVSRRSVWLVWINDVGSVDTAKILAFDTVDELRAGQVPIIVPKDVQRKEGNGGRSRTQ